MQNLRVQYTGVSKEIVSGHFFRWFFINKFPKAAESQLKILAQAVANSLK
jgi:hypothetical protein